MRLPRMTTRRWIVAAPGVALLMFLGRETARLRRIAHPHRQKAAGFATLERDIRAAADAMEACAQVQKTTGGGTAYWELHRFAVVDYIRADHYRLMKLKYERAATSPWHFIPPDPAEPAPEVPEAPPDVLESGRQAKAVGTYPSSD
jgi:hypothetical protein